MLRKVLESFYNSNGFSKSQLSKELGVSEAMIEESISQLIRMGYITQSNTSDECDIKCTSCPYAKSCNMETIKFYSISSKGEDYLKRNIA